MRAPVPFGIKTWREFWPYYLREHLNPTNRSLHLCGTSLSLILIVFLTATQSWSWLWLAVVCGYAFAWIGHLVFERNRPATWRYPFFSLFSDFVMLFKALTRQLNGEIANAVQDGKRDES